MPVALAVAGILADGGISAGDLTVAHPPSVNEEHSWAVCVDDFTQHLEMMIHEILARRA